MKLSIPSLKQSRKVYIMITGVIVLALIVVASLIIIFTFTKRPIIESLTSYPISEPVSDPVSYNVKLPAQLQTTFGYKECRDDINGFLSQIPSDWSCDHQWEAETEENTIITIPQIGKILINHPFGEGYCYEAAVDPNVKCMEEVIYSNDKFKIKTQRLTTDAVPGNVEGTLILRTANQSPDDLNTYEQLELGLNYNTYNKIDKLVFKKFLDSIQLSDKVYHEDSVFETRYVYINSITPSNDKYILSLDYIDVYFNEKADPYINSGKCSMAGYTCIQRSTGLKYIIKNTNSKARMFPALKDMNVCLNNRCSFIDGPTILPRYNERLFDHVIFKATIVGGKLLNLGSDYYSGDISGRVTNVNSATITLQLKDNSEKVFSYSADCDVALMKYDNSTFDQGRDINILRNAVATNFNQYNSNIVWLDFGDDYEAKVVHRIGNSFN